MYYCVLYVCQTKNIVHPLLYFRWPEMFCIVLHCVLRVCQTKNIVRVGKFLKKNNVAADVVSMGETDENQVR